MNDSQRTAFSHHPTADNLRGQPIQVIHPVTVVARKQQVFVQLPSIGFVMRAGRWKKAQKTPQEHFYHLHEKSSIKMIIESRFFKSSVPEYM